MSCTSFAAHPTPTLGHKSINKIHLVVIIQHRCQEGAAQEGATEGLLLTLTLALVGLVGLGKLKDSTPVAYCIDLPLILPGGPSGRHPHSWICLVLSCFFRVHPRRAFSGACRSRPTLYRAEHYTPVGRAGCSGLTHLNHLGVLCGSDTCMPVLDHKFVENTMRSDLSLQSHLSKDAQIPTILLP